MIKRLSIIANVQQMRNQVLTWWPTQLPVEEPIKWKGPCQGLCHTMSILSRVWTHQTTLCTSKWMHHMQRPPPIAKWNYKYSSSLLTIDILLTSETHLIDKNNLMISGYKFYDTKHRNGKCHGGSGILLTHHGTLWLYASPNYKRSRTGSVSRTVCKLFQHAW